MRVGKYILFLNENFKYFKNYSTTQMLLKLRQVNDDFFSFSDAFK